MADKSDLFGPRRSSLVDLLNDKSPSVKTEPEEGEEDSCAAFGFLRGLRERALNLEFRFRNGNREWFPYSHLSGCRFNPSVGILMKFTGEVITLVLIYGSNLDLPTGQGNIDLIERGLERHRVTWIREMEEQELRRIGEREPTIDRIEIAECESLEAVQAWLKEKAPVFLR